MFMAGFTLPVLGAALLVGASLFSTIEQSIRIPVGMVGLTALVASPFLLTGAYCFRRNWVYGRIVPALVVNASYGKDLPLAVELGAKHLLSQVHAGGIVSALKNENDYVVRFVDNGLIVTRFFTEDHSGRHWQSGEVVWLCICGGRIRPEFLSVAAPPPWNEIEVPRETKEALLATLAGNGY